MRNNKRKHQLDDINEENCDEESVVSSIANDSEGMESEENGIDEISSEGNATDSEAMDTDNDHMNGDNENNNGEEEEEAVSPNTSTKKNKKDAKDPKIKGMTVKELNNLRETETIFHSNLFRLQLDEMLSEVKLKDKYRNRIDEWLKSFQTLLLSIKSGKSYDLTDQLWCKKVKVPLIQEPFAVTGNFCFQTPKVSKIIGSYDLGTAIGPQTIIDIAVEIPRSCWQRHDNLNHRYLRKRALYLSHICQTIKSNELIADIKFSYFKGNHMKPIALIEPKGHLSKHFRVALTAYPEEDNKSINWKRFTPELNNIRSEWLQLTDCEDLSTPTYNSCIQNDINLISNYEYLVKTIGSSSSLKDGLKLLKLWLKQRKLKNDFYFVVSLFVCYLIEKQKISLNFSCYQIFRTTLLSIVNSKWDSEGISLTEDTYQPVSDYLNLFPVVFLDISGYHNICWDITIDSYERLRHESKLAIDCLDSNQKNSFELTFLTPIRFENKFDALLKLSVPSLLECSKASDIRSDITDNCGDTITAFVGHLIPLCKRAVGRRILLLEHKSKSYDDIEWSSDQLPPHPNDKQWITFGFLIDSQNAYNNIERGPAADSPDAKQFKDFWGEKSELRRFQDNSICEAVYWNSKTFADKRKIISLSLEYILSNILEIPVQSIFTTTSLLDSVVERPYLKFANKTLYGTGEELALSISQQFDTLAKRLRSVDGLPLTITSVQGIDSIFRATDVFPPLAMNSGKSERHFANCNIFDLSVEQKVVKYFKPIQVIIHLEGSGKWPNDLEAFLRVKGTFYLEISQKLSQQFGLITYGAPDHVDIFQNGWIFRIIIGSYKEINLRRQIITSEGLVKHIDNKEADSLETKTEVLPKINSALSALSRTHLCYGMGCRLAKRWVASQMLSLYLDDMAIDLMMAYIFLNPNPYTVPNSPNVAFLRFLSLICDHNWKITPLIIELNNETNNEMSTKISEEFLKKRHEFPPMFITTTFDKHWSEWTRHWPDSVILKRLQVLANSAKQTLISQLENPSEMDPKVIFRPDLDIYDLLITLKTDQLINANQSIDYKQKNHLFVKEFEPKLNHRMPIIDFNPIGLYLQQLIQSYSRFALFFYDKFGGQQIGVLWKPSVFESKPLNISELNGVRLTLTADKSGIQNVVTNIEALIEDFSLVGDGLIASLDVRAHNWDKYESTYKK